MGKDASTLPNVASVLRAEAKPAIGTKTLEYYEAPYHRWFRGVISKVPDAQNRGYWVIRYQDGDTLTVTDETEIRRAIDATCLPEWQALVAKVQGAFTYLEN
eukprot:scaffold241392_cov33-Tisochrysis_lutea.AAC.1